MINQADNLLSQLQQAGARVEDEVTVEETATSKKTTRRAIVDEALLADITANQALTRFAHTGYDSLLRLCGELGRRLDEDALKGVFVNFLYAAVQDAVTKAALANPDLTALTLTRAGLDLRSRFAGAVRAIMRDDKQPEIQAWLSSLTDAQLDQWRAKAKALRPDPATPTEG